MSTTRALYASGSTAPTRRKRNDNYLFVECLCRPGEHNRTAFRIGKCTIYTRTYDIAYCVRVSDIDACYIENERTREAENRRNGLIPTRRETEQRVGRTSETEICTWRERERDMEDWDERRSVKGDETRAREL